MSKRKLLLADDSITIQKVVNLTFADEGIEVITFGDGDTALGSIDEVKPDIVLADVNMPGTNGYRLCELLRANEATKHVPVVLLVGSFEPFDQDEADRVGADRYLTKPFRSIAELVATVNELLEATARVDEANPDEAPNEPEVPDTNDIESLYKQSFIETVKFSSSDNLDVEFSDDGIDDEMIQTSYAESDIDSLANASFFAPDEIDDFVESPEPVTGEPAISTEENTRHERLADEEIQRQPDVWPVEDAHFEGAAEADMPINPPETDLPDEDAIHSLTSAETLSFEHAEPEGKSLMPRVDDLDILELPEIPTGTAYEITTPGQGADSGSQTQIVNLSPELIDIIVQKVVEKLAEKY